MTTRLARLTFGGLGRRLGEGTRTLRSSGQEGGGLGRAAALWWCRRRGPAAYVRHGAGRQRLLQAPSAMA
jgi:hypothetical protein